MGMRGALPDRDSGTGADGECRYTATRHPTDDHGVWNVTSNVSLHEMSVPHVMVMVSVPEPPLSWRSWKLIASLPWQLSWALS
jgi:hypothetical protein